jgi:hypothetical protein
MDEPAKAASRLLYGTGFGLILVCGFGLVQGRMDIGNVGISHIFLLIALVCIALAKLLSQKTSFLISYFPNEGEGDMRERIQQEIHEDEVDSAVGNAWAKLESQVLETEISIEEE